MRILVIGRNGQVARSLSANAREQVSILCLGRPELDLTNRESIERAIRQFRPQIVVNAAAYTAVDKAESEPEIAFAINSHGAENASMMAAQAGVPIIHLSTDYVFSGDKPSPYVETDAVRPMNVYGRSKLAGERAVSQSNPAHVILRTSWIYAPWGHNFARTMLRLAETRDAVNVVADQHGTPTFAPDIADGIIAVSKRILRTPNDPSWRGIFHMTSQGSTTWAGFAEAIFGTSALAGGPSAKVLPISTSQYPTAAQRPANSVLDTSKFEIVFAHRIPHWENGLKRFLRDYRDY